MCTGLNYYARPGPPHLYTVATLPWEIQKSHFRQHYPYILQIIYVISEENKLLRPYPPHLKKCHNTTYYIFTARRYASAVLAVIVCLSVRPSVRLSVCPSDTSRSCTKMAKHRIRQTTPYDSTETLVFRCQKSWRNSNDITPNGGTKERWVRFLAALCSGYLAIFQKRCKIGTQLLWKANRNSYVLYRMVLFSMTLGDP